MSQAMLTERGIAIANRLVAVVRSGNTTGTWGGGATPGAIGNVIPASVVRLARTRVPLTQYGCEDHDRKGNDHASQFEEEFLVRAELTTPRSLANG
jgi:hypothetical protein